MANDPVTAALDFGGKLIDRLWQDPTQRDAAKLEMFKMTQTGELAQLTSDTELAKSQAAVNAVEAANPSIFVSGWRPFVGWVCGLGLASQFIVAPLATWGAALAGHAVAFPALDLGTLMTLLFGMLGLGAARTVEKINGVARK